MEHEKLRPIYSFHPNDTPLVAESGCWELIVIWVESSVGLMRCESAWRVATCDAKHIGRIFL